MNKSNWLMMTLLLAAALVTQTGCNDNKPAAPTAPVAPATTNAAAVKYTCTMHPEVVKDAPGSCPICGMTLVQKP